MSIIDTPTIADDAQNSFPSLAALQAAHLTLLKLRREAKATDVLISDIIVFLQRGRVIGRLLDTDGDRQAAQSLLDYWANALHRLQIDPPYVALVDFDPLLAPELPDEPAQQPSVLRPRSCAR